MFAENATDNCPDMPNSDQENTDNDSNGDVCDCDEDSHGILEKCNFTDADGDGVEEYSNCSLPQYDYTLIRLYTFMSRAP